MGKLVLGTEDVEESYWTSLKAQKNELDYWYGVFPFPREVRRYALVCAAINTLQSQMGTTHNIPSTMTMPEGSLTVGQAYINIETTRKALETEKAQLEKRLIKYTSFA